MRIWHGKPGEELFNRTLSIGNGLLGATLNASPIKESILLNHAWLWRDLKARGREQPSCAHWLPYIRQLFFEGKTQEAGILAQRVLGSQASAASPFFEPEITQRHYGPDPFVPAGYLEVYCADVLAYGNFRSEIDLASSEASVEYSANGVNFTRKAIASRINDLIGLKFEAGNPHKISLSFSLLRIDDPECELAAGFCSNVIWLKGAFIEGKVFSIAVKIIASGGETAYANGKCVIEKCDAAEAFIAVATDHENENPLEHCLEMLAKAECYDEFRAEASEAHQQLFSRVSFEIGGDDYSDIPTDKRLMNFAAGAEDQQLQNLLVEYGRYLDISYSKQKGVPGNLNGLWSDELYPAWNCDLHHDINSQGMYWSIDPLRISETGDVLFDYLESLIPAGKAAAKKLYGCNGLFIPISTSCWPYAFKLEPGWDEFTGAAAWLSEHFWWRWDFTRDIEFLKERCYPFMREAGLFYIDYLVKDPRVDHRFYGKLQAVPSYSPENCFIGGSRPVSLSITCTFELELIYELFKRLVAAAEILNVDHEFKNKCEYALDNLPPLQIGKYGQLQEWIEDYPENESIVESLGSAEGVGHRHLSPLLGVFPGEMITPRQTPELAQAAYVFARRRIEHLGAKGGWSAWMAAIMARLAKPEEAQERIRVFFNEPRVRSFSPNGGLYNGVVSAQLEMVVQSHEGDINLLPALPKEWKSGKISGIRARGDFSVEMGWRDHVLECAKITSFSGNPLTLSYKGRSVKLPTKKGEAYTFTNELRLC
jgi:alpha-L-fucosidase 2